MNDPRETPANDGVIPSTDVDELASRLLDGDIGASDVPSSLRDDVTRRKETFARQRDVLGEITGSISPATIDRSVDRALSAYRRQRAVRRPRTVGVAAAAASILVLAGLGLTRVGSDETMIVADDQASVMITSDTAATGTKDAATMSQSAEATPSPALTPDDPIVEFDSADELRSLAETWSVEEFTRESSQQTTVTPCLSEPTTRLLTRNARFRGQPVEIYRADTGDITVYAQSDCAVLLRLGA